MPAVLMTNGFGGSKDDQAALAAFFAQRDYVALTYSGLGFGGSSCEITLDDPDFDGKAASQLIDFLGGVEGIGFEQYDALTKQHSDPVAALEEVELDGLSGDHDPRVGMLGGSYGGQVQYAAASVTDKLDTIVPLITWNDLSYSLGPNNTSQIRGVTTEVPGAVKFNWVAGFSTLGALADPQNQQPPEPTELPCPNFPEWVCPALGQGLVTGTLSDDAISRLREASVSTYVEDVDIPTLILQGQADTLFNLNEAVATYEALQQQGTEVKMSWIEYGHSGAPAPGEMNFADPDPATQHITKRVTAWFDHHLKGSEVSTGPEFSYFRPWVSYNGIATPAYRSHDRYPVGRDSVYYLSGGKRLLTDPNDVTAGSQSFITSPAPTASDGDIDVIGRFLERPEQTETDPPGTFAQYTTSPLARAVEVVGLPRARLQVEAPTAAQMQAQDDALKLVVFLKILDVSPTGSTKVVRNLAAPVRVPDVTEPFTVTMPGFVHRFARGHKIRLAVAGSSPNYLNGRNPTPVTVRTGAEDFGDAQSSSDAALANTDLPVQSITLPTIGTVPPSRGGTETTSADRGGHSSGSGAGKDDDSGRETPRASNEIRADNDAQNRAAAPGRAALGTDANSSWLPETGGPAFWLLLAGALLTGAGAWLVGRRHHTGSSESL